MTPAYTLDPEELRESGSALREIADRLTILSCRVPAVTSDDMMMVLADFSDIDVWLRMTIADLIDAEVSRPARRDNVIPMTRRT